MAINIREELTKNAHQTNIFGGRRFLGFTPKNSPVWVSYTAYREIGKIIIKTTHDLNVLLQDEAVLSTKRVVLKKNSKNIKQIDNLLRANRHNMGGEVSKSTIVYLQKIISTIEQGYGKAFIEGKPTKLMFSYVANAIFEGSYDWENGDTSWSYVAKVWDFPTGEYFTIDSLSNNYDN
jgi:hypothetical protein